MDYSEAIEVVFRRIGELINPQNAAKVLGYILLQNQGVPEMLRLANAPTNVLRTIIDEIEQKLSSSLESSHSDKGKKPLVVSQLPTKFTPFVPSSFPQNLQHVPQASSNSSHNILHNVFPLEEQFGSCTLNLPFHPPQPYLKPSSSCPNIPHELAKRVCDDFSQGYCRHGGDCKLLHLYQMGNGGLMILNPNRKDETTTPDHSLQRGTLKHLEMELVELLRCRRNIPISISSIPILYFDKYAMPLQVEGYLLADRNKEEFISTMKRLLAQMENTICILNRPHGRPSIVLAEDLKHTKKPRSDGGPGMELRVYMTFTPQSTFTEQDAHNYFENFGPVQDVNIPHHVKRMFGFVTFVYPETAALVLSKTNPHYICGSQIMVKPYRLNH